MVELASHMTDNEVDYDMAVLYVFLIFTPVLLLVSWLLEIVIDTPSKNFAHNLDTLTRYVNPRTGKLDEDDEEDEDRTCGGFLYKNWVMWVILGLIFSVGLSTIIYESIDGNGDRIRAMNATYTKNGTKIVS